MILISQRIGEIHRKGKYIGSIELTKLDTKVSNLLPYMLNNEELAWGFQIR